MAVDQAVIEAYARPPTWLKHLVMLEIDHNLLSEKIRLAGHDHDVMYYGVLYSAWSISAAEHSLGGEPGASINLSLDGTDGSLHGILTPLCESPDPTTVVVRQVAYNTKTKVALPSESVQLGVMSLLSVEMKGASIELRLGHRSLANMPCPAIRYTREDYPGIYED